jgi:hypothetical protein
MIKRLNWALAAIACLVGLAGCATSPSTYRVAAQVADDGKPALWLLPPSADIWSSFRWADSAPSNGFYIDFPLRQSACPYYAKFPEGVPNKGALQGEVVPAAGRTLLRMKSTGAFLDDESLRAAWSAWWATAKDSWPGKCLGIDERIVEQSLVKRRPLRFTELLRVHYGFDESTRSVILRPGTTVCVSDVAYRDQGAITRFSAAGESCTTAMSDGERGVVLWPLVIPLQGIADSNKSKWKDPITGKPIVVLPIASWLELPHKAGHQFILRYPQFLPTTPSAMPVPVPPTPPTHRDAGKVPLLILIDARVAGSVARAMKCVAAPDNEILEFCGEQGFEADSCGGQIKASDPLAVLKTRPPMCFRFGERGVITPMVSVTVRGASLEVPLGTTLGGILERYAPPPHSQLARVHDSAAQAAAQAAVTGVRLMRMFEGKPVAVDLPGADASALDLVLLPGDQLSW